MDYLDSSFCITRVRKIPSHWGERVLRKVVSSLAISDWYSLGSLRLEYAGWRRIRNVQGITHLLWADRDWGFLDILPGMKRVPIVGTFHACPDDFSSTVSKPHRLSNLAGVILMSEVQRQNFVNAGMPEERIHVVLHGIDTKHFRPAEEAKQSSMRFNVLHVGSYRRNFDILEQVCDRLKEHPYIRFQIITSPAIADRFRDKLNIEVLCGLSDGQLLQRYQSASCMLMTAEAATANNAILEGIACGLPVVAERVGGIPEYVNTECAILCEPCDIDGLVNALEMLAADGEICRGMGIAARHRALELDWVHIAKKTEAIYEQIRTEYSM